MWPKALNLTNVTGQTPVHIPCTQWKNITVENIHHISNNFKININAVDCDGNTPLHLWVATSNIEEPYGQQKFLDYLLDKVFVDVNHRNSFRMRLLEISYKRIQKLKHFLEREKIVNAQKHCRITSLDKK
jgi:ankyrin repeat protein